MPDDMKFSKSRLDLIKRSAKRIAEIQVKDIDEFPEEETKTTRELRQLDSKSPTAVKVSMTLPEKHRIYFNSLVVICVTIIFLYVIHKGYLEFILNKL